MNLVAIDDHHPPRTACVAFPRWRPRYPGGPRGASRKPRLKEELSEYGK